VRGQVLAELSETRSQAETDRLGRELADKIKRLKNPSDDELRKLQNEEVTYNETPWAAKGDPIAGIGANARFSDEIWSLKLGQISTTPITTNRGPAFVKPTEERPAGLPPLEEIKAKVTTDFQADKRDQEAIAKLQPVVQELSSGKTLAAVATQYETEVKTTPEFGPGGPVPEIGTAPELSAAVFKTEKGQTGPPSRCPRIRALPRRQPRQRGLEDVRDPETRDPGDAAGPRGGPPAAGGAAADARGPEGPGQRRGAEDIPAGAGRSPPGMSEKRGLRPETLAVHAGKRPDPSGGGPLVDPIFQTAPFSFVDTDALANASEGQPPDSFYTREGNPTVASVEKKLAALEGSEDAALFGSGMGAIATAFQAHLKRGDHVVATEDLYGGALRFFRDVLEPMGVTTTLVATEPRPKLEEAVRPETRWVYVESPTNPLVKIVDLAFVADIARRLGLTAVIDGTFASPVLQHPLALGFHLVLHSATKYLNGHADVTAGFAAGSREILEPIRARRIRTGAILDPLAAFLLNRGMKTLPLRVERQSENALRLAEWLSALAAIEKVHYPGLAAHAGHDAARRQMKAFGAMLAFDLNGGIDKARRFLTRLELIALATSLGSVETTADLPWLTSHRHVLPEKKRALGIQEGTIRLSVGAEALEDLKEDLESAMGTGVRGNAGFRRQASGTGAQPET
jgi:cystathionine beta-lyase/cystathionine gamma-synthase